MMYVTKVGLCTKRDDKEAKASICVNHERCTRNRSTVFSSKKDKQLSRTARKKEEREAMKCFA